MEKPPTDISSMVKDTIKETVTLSFLMGIYARHFHGDQCFINVRDKWSQGTAVNSNKR